MRAILRVVCMLVAARAVADDEGVHARSLGGHVFPTTRSVRVPFTLTNVGLSATLGGGRVEGPDLDVNGVQVGLRGYDLAGMAQTIRGGVRLADPVLLRFEAEAAAYSGTNTRSALVVGASAYGASGLGLTIGQTFFERLRLALLADFAFRPGYELTVVPGILASIQQQQVVPTGVSTYSERWTFSAGISGAWALAKPLGLLAEVGWTHPRSAVGGSITNDDDLQAGVQLDLDFGAFTPVPVGLVAGYRITNAFASGAALRRQEPNVGVFYTGRERLVLGLEAGALLTELRPGLDTRLFMLTATLRHYWP